MSIVTPVVSAGTGPPVESALLAGRRYESPFSVEELLSLVIPKQQSQDIDMDPCKAPAFIGQHNISIRFFYSKLSKSKKKHIFHPYLLCTY